MKVKLKKLYVVIGNYEVLNDEGEVVEIRENVVIKAFEQNTEKSQIGVWYKKGVNFDEKTDFTNAIILEGLHFEDVVIGVTKVVDGVVL